MIILSLNCGSSSIKYSLFGMGEEERRLARGKAERIGHEDARLVIDSPEGRKEHRISSLDHGQVLSLILEASRLPLQGSSSRGMGIDAVGHRVVHGGERFKKPSLIDEDVVRAIEAHSSLASLHNPPNLAGIRAASALLPGVPQVAVFDTAFHQSLSPRAFLYPLPRSLCEKYHIRRYGFHGISHSFTAREAGVDKPQQATV